VGFERTRVTLIADPAAHRNIHEIRAKGAFGSLGFVIENNPLPDNPRTSLLAALSIEAEVRTRFESMGPG
jgi:aspartate dehydrogenase